MNMRLLALAALFVIGCALERAASQIFKSQQAKFPRVQTAIAEKGEAVRRLFAAKHLAFPSNDIFFRAFQREGVLELWAKGDGKYELIKEYKICAASGSLGPKRRQGDNQVPEGFYYVDRFNPASNFYLSLGVN